MHLLCTLTLSLSALVTLVAAASSPTKTVETLFLGYRPTITLGIDHSTSTSALSTTGFWASVVNVSDSTTVYSLGCAPSVTDCFKEQTHLVTMGPSTMSYFISEVDGNPFTTQIKASPTTTLYPPVSTVVQKVGCELKGTTKATCSVSAAITQQGGPVTLPNGKTKTLRHTSITFGSTTVISGDEMWFPKATITAGVEKLETGAANARRGGVNAAAGVVGALVAGAMAL